MHLLARSANVRFAKYSLWSNSSKSSFALSIGSRGLIKIVLAAWSIATGSTLLAFSSCAAWLALTSSVKVLSFDAWRSRGSSHV